MKNVKAKRLFIAFRLPDHIREMVDLFLETISQASRGVAWVSPHSLHITLHFLGMINPEEEEKIKSAMRDSAGKYQAQDFSLGRLNGFPDLVAPEVLYLEIRQTKGNSANLFQRVLGKKLSDLAMIDKRKWHPHLTLGRVKDTKALRLPDNMISPKAEFRISEYALMESKPHSDYSLVEKYGLSK